MNQTITNKIRKYIFRHNLLNNDDFVLVALSGGADSVFLLRVLLHLGYNVEAIHCNFHLRGQESMRDETFVRDLCKRLKVTLHVKHFDTTDYAHTHHQSIELAARTLRYDYFEQLRQQRHATLIAVAHHRDDNVETMIWNMVRGTGLRGLRGMLPRNGFIVRPLLNISRKEIINALDDIKQDYVTDSSNLQTDYTRNKIRHEVIPLLQTLNPAAEKNLSTMMDNMQDIWSIYSQYIEEAKRTCVTEANDMIRIDLSRLSPDAPCRTILHEILSPYGFNRTQTDDMFSALSGKVFTSEHCEAHVKVSASGKRVIRVITPKTNEITE